MVREITVIGGGAGSFNLLSGLRSQTDFALRSIVTMMDSGGDSGTLRDACGVLPPGDLRRCLVALSEESQILRDLFSFRFEDGPTKARIRIANMSVDPTLSMLFSRELRIERATVAGLVFTLPEQPEEKEDEPLWIEPPLEVSVRDFTLEDARVFDGKKQLLHVKQLGIAAHWSLDAIVVEPFHVHDVGAAPTDADFAAIRTATADYMAVAAPVMRRRLDRSNMRIEAGVELLRDGDLQLGALELSDWRFDGSPIALTTRASGSITVAGTISANRSARSSLAASS